MSAEARALIERFDHLRNSGVCSPTTRGLLDDAQSLLLALSTPPADDASRCTECKHSHEFGEHVRTALRHADLADELRTHLEDVEQSTLNGLLRSLAANVRRLVSNRYTFVEPSRNPGQFESTPPADDVREALTSVEELEALPTRSVVMDGSGEVWRKTVTGLWDCLDGQGNQPVEESATVIWQSAPPRVTVLWASGEVRPRGTVTDAEVEAALASLVDSAECYYGHTTQGVRAALEAAREARS